MKMITNEIFYSGMELVPGIFLQTKEELTEEQKYWADEDPCKNMNFNSYNFWVTTDCGDFDPVGFNKVSEAMETILEETK